MFLPLYWVALGQMGTNLISMAASMTTNGTPNDFLANTNPVALILLIPVMDILIYPALRHRGIHLQPIFKIWLGFMFATLAMVYSAFLQRWIYQTNPCGEYVGACDQPSSISVWLQTPCYVLLAISEIFTSITALEYSYNKAPKKMKSVAMSVFLFSSSVGSVSPLCHLDAIFKIILLHMHS
jgi:proton-dependent oligopeptide transporter, POT family